MSGKEAKNVFHAKEKGKLIHDVVVFFAVCTFAAHGKTIPIKSIINSKLQIKFGLI